MRVLLISTYELGRQPVHIASPAAALRVAGHQVATVDVAVDTLTREQVDLADAVAISVPMHTASRLGESWAAQVSALSPGKPVAMYGLYAGVVETDVPRFAGEYEPALLSWVEALESGGRVTGTVVAHTGRSAFEIPDRAGLASLDRYARLERHGTAIVAGAVEASHGCRHRCRHCPIPPVYDGRMRVVPRDVVLADIASLVKQGAGHVTFGDPDFLNAPRHSLDVIREAHRRHPAVTFDVTVKVEHIIEHGDLWPEIAESNLLFVVSAFESVDDETLQILDKGHTVADMSAAIGLLRDSGIHIRPTWLPFLPWTQPGHVIGIFRFLDAHDLNGATDPVQLSIKLLMPRGSLLEEHPAVVPHLHAYRPEYLSWEWSFSDPTTELIQKELEAIAAEASDRGQEAVTTIRSMRAAVESHTGETLGEMRLPQGVVPRLTESWFCCAEPTETQAVSVHIGRG